MNFATSYQKPGNEVRCHKRMDFAGDWVKNCESEMNMKEGFHIEDDDDVDDNGSRWSKDIRQDREYLDIAAG